MKKHFNYNYDRPNHPKLAICDIGRIGSNKKRPHRIIINNREEVTCKLCQKALAHKPLSK